MSQTLRKRGRRLDYVEVGEPKCFHLEETEPSLRLLQFHKSLSDDDYEECSPNDEIVNRVMRSLEEEIATRNSTSGDNSAVDDISSGLEDQARDSDLEQELCYLLEASDDVLGIPPMPSMDLKYGLSEIEDLESFREKCYLEDDFENYQDFAVSEDAWNAKQLQDYLN